MTQQTPLIWFLPQISANCFASARLGKCTACSVQRAAHIQALPHTHARCGLTPQNTTAQQAKALNKRRALPHKQPRTACGSMQVAARVGRAAELAGSKLGAAAALLGGLVEVVHQVWDVCK